jgi:hypothetical protein
LTKIAALNRMQLLQQQQQQQRNNALGSSNRMTSGSSSNLFNNSLEVAHEEARLDIVQSFSSTNTNSMRT